MRNPVLAVRGLRVANAMPVRDSDIKDHYCGELDRFQELLFRLLEPVYRDTVLSKLIALKVCNLLAAEYHFQHRHARLSSRPVQLLIDPANGCQLRCPGCVHSANDAWRAQFDWPQGLLSVEQAAELFGQLGPFACAAVLYNYGEPLLNKRFPEIVSSAKAYGLFTMTSSNLALPINADRLVESGLDRLVVSADGASQASYQRFRRRGKLDLVFDNMAAIVEAKQRHASQTPYVVWQFLTFEHNAGEVDTAVALASQLGINEIHFATPFSVEGDDPSLKGTSSRRQGRIVVGPVARGSGRRRRALASTQCSAQVEMQVDAAFRMSWRDRLKDAGGGEEESRPTAPTCGWLYHNLTIDAARRVMPCCIAPSPEKGVRNLVYSHFDGQAANVTNSPNAVFSRRAFADGATARAAVKCGDPTELPHCIRCAVRPAAPYSFQGRPPYPFPRRPGRHSPGNLRSVATLRALRDRTARRVMSRFWKRQPRDFIRAVHYFGRAHPTNFWDAAPMDEVAEHLARIREDGFNTIVLVVPWRGFQRTLSPPTYDPANLEKLRKMLEVVDSAGLRTILRVSYPWNNDPGSELSFDERVIGLFTRPEVRDAWVSYLGTLKLIADASPGFRFAFFSWEDLPSIRELMIHRCRQERLALAEATGYRAFLRLRFDLAEVSRMFGETFRDFSAVYIPLPNCEAYKTYNEFVNRGFGDLLTLGRTAWPSLTMQIRADFERVDIAGETVWIENDVRSWDSELRVSYYFPYMYAQCRGETLTAREALTFFGRVMKRVSNGGAAKNHWLDQLVFYDESPQFRHWPKIDDKELQRFLLRAVDLLKKVSRGYGIWNYFDYRVNHLYNPNFLRGLEGWAARNDVTVRSAGDRRGWVTLSPGARISQQLVPDLRGNATSLYESVKFCALAAADDPSSLRISTNGIVEAPIALVPGARREVTAELRPDLHRGGDLVEFTIENSGPAAIELTDLCLWGFVYRSRIYDEEGRPGPYLHHIRKMNRR